MGQEDGAQGATLVEGSRVARKRERVGPIPDGHAGVPTRAEAPGTPMLLEILPHERSFLGARFTGLTPRERDVLFELCSGGTNERIADRLCVALPTLRTHVMRINQKLGTTSKADIVGLVARFLVDGYRRGAVRPIPPEDGVAIRAHNVEIPAGSSFPMMRGPGGS